MSARLRSLSPLAIVAAMLLGGCAAKAPPFDYTAYRKAKPATMLVMPPVNDSPDVKATPSVWATATLPLAEAGYYVLPVMLVDEMFKQNGVQSANDAAEVPFAKLREVFGADAAVYIRIKRYGTSYKVVDSETRVDVEGRVVDLKTGDLLWKGSAFASSAEQAQQNQGGLVGLLVAAVVKQIISANVDAAFNFGATANRRLLTPQYNGILAGPRSPFYGKDPQTP